MTFRRAITPSIENTPSVAISRTRASARLLQARLELVEVVVRVAEPARLAETDAVDDARVIERVADHRVLLVEQRLEEAAVGVETGRIEDRVVHPEERGEPRFELLVHGLRAADEAHRGHAVTVAVDRAMCRLAHRRVIGEAQVIVGAEVDEVAPVGQTHHRLLRRAQHAFRLEEPLLTQAVCLGGQPIEKRLVQGASCGSGDYRGPIIAA